MLLKFVPTRSCPQMIKLLIAAVIAAVTFAAPTQATANCGVPALHAMAQKLNALDQEFLGVLQGYTSANYTFVKQLLVSLGAVQTELTNVSNGIQSGKIRANQPAASLEVAKLQARITSLRERAGART